MLFSCHQKPDYKVELKTLDSLLATIDTNRARIDQFDAAVLLTFNDTIDTTLKYVQANFVGLMDQKMALTLSDYNQLKKENIAMHNKSIELIDRCEILEGQCKELKKALIENATVDAQNNEINADYVAQHLKEEQHHIELLTDEINIWKNNLTALHEKFEQYYPQMKFWTDSIPPRRN